MLEDLLAPKLRLLVCGTAAGSQSALARQYYAAKGNRFWSTLAEVGLTPRRLESSEYRELLEYEIGLTDIVKGQSGSDHSLVHANSDVSTIGEKIRQFQPSVLCFNGKKSASIFLGQRRIEYGRQAGETAVGRTILFVAPSTSGQARRWWDLSLWHELAELVKSA